MKTLTTRFVIAVAALAVAAASASAQTYKADIPMAFRAGSELLRAGAYEVRLDRSYDGQPMLTIRSLSTTKRSVLIATPGRDPAKSWKRDGHAVISFQCLGGQCALSELWTGSTAASTYSFPGLKLRPADVERIASISVALTRGD